MDNAVGPGTTVQLTQRNVNGTSVLGLENSNLNLVKRDGKDGWEPVDKFDGPIGSAELDKNYGVWVDKKLVSDHWYGQRVERPLDGKPQADEVMGFENFRGFQHSYITHWKQDQDDVYSCDQSQLTPGPNGVTIDSSWSHYTTYNGMHGLFGAHMSPMAPAAVQQLASHEQGFEVSWDVPLPELQKTN